MESKIKLLVIVPPSFIVPGSIFEFNNMKKVIQDKIDMFIENPQDLKVISTIEEYNAIDELTRYSYEVLLVQFGSIAPDVIDDQVQKSQKLKWVHSINNGADGYLAKKSFKESEIPLTNAKGAYSDVLGEFVALGVLYHTKHVERFMRRKEQKKWETEPMELVSNKHMAVIGYGDIGSACAKIAKLGFGMKVTGVKRDPKTVNDLQRSYCDEIVGQDEYERVIKEADFVVGVLPKVIGVTEHFFNIESTFSKMKKSAVFMNIGRGLTVKETDLVKALKEKLIAGAVLDVFEKEPLTENSEIWECENVLITPHCADQDSDHCLRAIAIFGENLQRYSKDGTKNLINIIDKQLGY